MNNRFLSLGFFLCFSVTAKATPSAPFTPKEDSQVLERLPRDLFRSKTSGSKNLDPALLASQVRQALDAAREDGDVRLLGHAQAMLGNIDPATSPVELVVLEALILQRLHHFDPALKRLDAALQRDNKNIQAFLTKASILQVQGKLTEAKAVGEELSKVSKILGQIIPTSVQSISDPESAWKKLESLATDSQLPSAEKIWVLGLAAEAAERAGNWTKAENFHRRAITANMRDPFAIGAYADFLIQRQSASRAISLLRPHRENDGLLLREVIARKSAKMEDPELTQLVADLETRFDAVKARGESRHWREEAMFEFHVRNNPSKALSLAKENWKEQKEAIDAAILIQASLAAEQPAEARTVLQWIKENNAKDARLDSFNGQLKITNSPQAKL